MYFSKRIPMFEEIINNKLYQGDSFVLRVFNPDVKTLEDHPFNVTVSANDYYLAVHDDYTLIQTQALPISYYDNYDKVQEFNKTHSSLIFLIPSTAPFSL